MLGEIMMRTGMAEDRLERERKAALLAGCHVELIALSASQRTVLMHWPTSGIYVGPSKIDSIGIAGAVATVSTIREMLDYGLLIRDATHLKATPVGRAWAEHFRPGICWWCHQDHALLVVPNSGSVICPTCCLANYHEHDFVWDDFEGINHCCQCGTAKPGEEPREFYDEC